MGHWEAGGSEGGIYLRVREEATQSLLALHPPHPHPLYLPHPPLLTHPHYHSHSHSHYRCYYRYHYRYRYRYHYHCSPLFLPVLSAAVVAAAATFECSLH
jgi:hypothetical protein